MNRLTFRRHSIFLGLSLFVFLVMGCPSDPSDISLTTDDAGHDDAGDTSDAGDVDAAEVTDAPDADMERECMVPRYFGTLKEAIDFGCDTIDIDEDIHPGHFNPGEERINLNHDLTLRGLEGTQKTVSIPETGFVVASGHELRLIDLKIEPDLPNHDTNLVAPLVELGGAGSLLHTENVEISGFRALETPLILVTNTAAIELNSTMIDDNGSVTNGPIVIECRSFSSVRIFDQSQISNNYVDITRSGLDETFEATGGAIGLEDCDFELQDSAITTNRLRLVVDQLADPNNSNNQIRILLAGAGIYAERGTIDIRESSLINDNKIYFHLDNINAEISPNALLYGAGVALNDSSLSLLDSTIEENNINQHFEGGGDIMVNSSGAGLSITNDGDGQLISRLENSTISMNQLTHSVPEGSTAKTSLLARGAGVDFTAYGNAQLQMVNSTISGNAIEDATEGTAAGISIRGPGIEVPDNEGGEGEDDDWYCFLPWYCLVTLNEENDPDDSSSEDELPLTAVLRYTTIAGNKITSIKETPGPAGLQAITYNSDDAGPLLSLIGVLFNDNEVPSQSTTAEDIEVFDCDGTAIVGRLENNSGSEDPPDELDLTAPDWDSGYNIIHAGSRTNFLQGNCRSMLQSHQGNSDLFKEINTELSNLKFSTNGPTKVHEPTSDAYFNIDYGEREQCSTIESNAVLEFDQRGELRPDESTTYCGIGSVQQ